MKKNIIKFIGILSFGSLALNSCGDKTEPPLVYFPDMYYPVAYDPLMKAETAYSDDENSLPPFIANEGATGLTPVSGTVPQNKDGVMPDVLPRNTDEYNSMYDASKSVTTSPLDPTKQAEDLERGKKLYELTCVACHGTAGDGQGPIVVSGAYAGVPNYKDRQVSIGSVHYVLTNGRNAMGSYAGQLTPGDRWRVAMYVMNEFKGGVNNSANAVATTTVVPTPAAPVQTK